MIKKVSLIAVLLLGLVNANSSKFNLISFGASFPTDDFREFDSLEADTGFNLGYKYLYLISLTKKDFWSQKKFFLRLR